LCRPLCGFLRASGQRHHNGEQQYHRSHLLTSLLSLHRCNRSLRAQDPNYGHSSQAIRSPEYTELTTAMTSATPQPSLGYITTREGIDLSVRTLPGERRPWFLLVHGLASNAQLWCGVAARLAAAGFPSVAVDQRGHGLSQQVDTGFGFDALSLDLVDVMQTINTGPVVAVGQSWGGNVVVELAARHPKSVAGVGLIDGGFLRLAEDFPTWEIARESLAPPVFNGARMEDMRRAMTTRLEGFSSDAIEAQLANFEVNKDGTIRARLQRRNHFAILEQLWDHDPDIAASKISAPILAIAVEGGSPRKSGRVAEFAAAAGATVRWMTGHHDVHAQKPDVVARVLLDWTGEVLP
jgi:pimeloyl-ACP methyl ester carboxylesterase